MKYGWSLLLLLASPLFAQSYTAQWTAPTKNTDGSAITQTLNYTLWQATQGSTLAKVQTGIAGLSTTITKGLTPGTTQCFAVSALNTTTGSESAQTTPVCIAIPQPVPSAPGGLTITLATTSTIAYMVVPGADTYGVLIVGSVPLATQCDPTHGVLAGPVTYYIVPRTSVTLNAPFKNIPALLGQCS